jgi:PAS domain S-box-containing protein
MKTGRAAILSRLLSDWLLLVSIAVIITGGRIYYSYQRTIIRQKAYAQLGTLADLRAGQIANWYRERLGDANLVLGSGGVFEEVGDSLAENPPKPANPPLQSWISGLRQYYDYGSVVLFDRLGRPRCAAPPETAPCSSQEQADIQQALGTNGLTVKDLHRDSPAGPIWLDLYSPWLGKGSLGGEATGVIRFRVDPNRGLYPIVRTWPRNTLTAEVLLVRREGNEVVFLNELRQQTNSALTLRRPLAPCAEVETAVFAGQLGNIELPDYRGVRVLATARQVPGLPWMLIAKQDLQEIDAPLQHQAWTVVPFMIALILAIKLGLDSVEQKRHLDFFTRELQLKQQQAEAEARYRELFEHSPMGIWDEDFSAVKQRLDQLRAAGVEDLRSHLEANADEVRRLVALVRTSDINTAAWKSLGADGKDVVRNHMARYFCEESLPVLREGLIAIATGQLPFTAELPLKTLDRGLRPFELTLAVPDGYADSLARVLVSLHDITDRKRAEMLRVEQERNLRLLVKSLPLAVAIWRGKERQITYLNSTFTAWFGYGPEEVASCDAWWELAYPDEEARRANVAKWSRRETRAIETGAMAEPMEHRIRCKDGSSRQIQWGFIPMEEGGCIFGLDLTAHRRHEKEIEALNRLYLCLSKITQCIPGLTHRQTLFDETCRLLVEQAGFKMSWIGWTNPETRQVEVKAQQGDDTGYLREIMVYADDRPEGHGPGGTCIREGTAFVCPDFETHPSMQHWRHTAIRHGFGASISVPLRFKGVVAGAIMAYTGEKNFFGDKQVLLMEEMAASVSLALTHLDQQENRAAAEKYLQQAHEFRHHLLDRAPALIWMAGTDAKCTWFNQTWLEFTGRRMDQETGDGWAEGVHPEDLQRCVDQYLKAFAARESFMMEYRLRHRAGEFRWIADYGIPAYQGAGEFAGYIGYCFDVTAHREAEKNLALAHQKAARLNDLLWAIHQADDLIAMAADQPGLLQGVCETLVKNRGYVSVWIGRPDPVSGTVNSLAHAGVAQGFLQHAPIRWDDTPLGHGPTGTALRERRTIVFDNLAEDPRFAPWRDAVVATGAGSIAAIPLLYQEKLWGVITVKADRIAAFDQDELKLLESLALNLVAAQERITNTLGLRDNENRLRLALEVSRQGIYDVIDIKSGETITSPEYARMLGYDPADFRETTASWINRMHPEDQGPTAQLYLQHIQGKVPEYHAEYRLRTRAGDWIWVLSIGKIVGWDAQDRPCRLLGTHTDITERKKAEQAAQQLMTAIDQADESIVFTNLQGVILYVNQGYEKTSGYPRAEVIGKKNNVLKSGKHPDSFYRQLWETITQGQTWTGRFINRRKDGTLYEEESFISPVRTPWGEIVSYVATKRDVTRETQLERQLIEAQKMEAIGQLAGGIAHDYNNILSAITLQLGALLADRNLKPVMRESLETLKQGAAHAAALTRQLLMFSRRQAMHIELAEVNALINDEFKMLHRLLGEHIELTLSATGEEVWAEVDASMIGQVVMNLCINARDAMPDGGKLSLGVRKVELAAQANAQPGTYVCLTVLDTGCGMSRDTLDHIFEPFFTTKEVGKGTGLGLATVYGIVKQHKGWIEVASELGSGSEFRVYLPARPVPAEARPPRSVPVEIVYGTGTVLVVEDDTSVRDSLVMWLKTAGYRVQVAPTGSAAFQKWAEQLDQIDLLLTDVVMPGGLSGLDLMKSFRRIKPALPAIVMSGYNDELVQSDTPSLGDFIYLHKPFNEIELTTAVHQALKPA